MALAKCPGRPTCAVCGCPVEKFEWWDDDFVEHCYFVVKCHGRTQRVRVDHDTMRAMVSMGFGMAFTDEQRRLSPA